MITSQVSTMSSASSNFTSASSIIDPLSINDDVDFNSDKTIDLFTTPTQPQSTPTALKSNRLLSESGDVFTSSNKQHTFSSPVANSRMNYSNNDSMQHGSGFMDEKTFSLGDNSIDTTTPVSVTSSKHVHSHSNGSGLFIAADYDVTNSISQTQTTPMTDLDLPTPVISDFNSSLTLEHSNSTTLWYGTNESIAQNTTTNSIVADVTVETFSTNNTTIISFTNSSLSSNISSSSFSSSSSSSSSSFHPTIFNSSFIDSPSDTLESSTQLFDNSSYLTSYELSFDETPLNSPTPNEEASSTSTYSNLTSYEMSFDDIPFNSTSSYDIPPIDSYSNFTSNGIPSFDNYYSNLTSYEINSNDNYFSNISSYETPYNETFSNLSVYESPFSTNWTSNISPTNLEFDSNEYFITSPENFNSGHFNSRPFDSPNELILKVSILALISVFGSVGNLLVIGSIIKNRFLHRPPFYFLLSMAATDLSRAGFCIPVVMATTLDGSTWGHGSTACKLFAFASSFFVFSSTLSLLAIAVDRHASIVYTKAYRRRCHGLVNLAVAVITWAIAFCISFPPVLGVGRYVFIQEEAQCAFQHRSHHHSNGVAYVMLFIAITFLTYFLYFRVYRFMRSHRRMRPLQHQPAQSSTWTFVGPGANGQAFINWLNGFGGQPGNRHSGQRTVQRLNFGRVVNLSTSKNEHLTRLFLILTVVYGVLWTPYLIVCLWRIFLDPEALPSGFVTSAAWSSYAQVALSPLSYFLAKGRVKRPSRTIHAFPADRKEFLLENNTTTRK